jgi:Ca2+-transporting ATPase
MTEHKIPQQYHGLTSDEAKNVRKNSAKRINRRKEGELFSQNTRSTKRANVSSIDCCRHYLLYSWRAARWSNYARLVLGIISIDVIQEWKTDKTLKALKDLSAPHITVIRDGEERLLQCGFSSGRSDADSRGCKNPR